MLKGQIPSHVDPRKLADADVTLEGAWPLDRFARLVESLEDDQGTVRVRLTFRRDEQRTVVFRSQLEVEVKMVCQRCLELVDLPIHSECDYAVVYEGASAQHIPKDYEVLEVGEEPLDVVGLVEDELLLSLPIVPMHAADACEAPGDSGRESTESGPDVSNPFSVLAQLKRNPKD